MFTPRDPRLKKIARQHRSVPTLSEAQLWHELRNRKLSGLKFRRQHPLPPFVVDFFCAGHALIAEVDGSVHENIEVREADASRQRKLEGMGYRVIRFTVDEVMFEMEAVLEKILAACSEDVAQPATPLTQPLP
jgi:very-short-patch-repair endonuclease